MSDKTSLQSATGVCDEPDYESPGNAHSEKIELRSTPMRPWGWLSDLYKDVGYSLRVLRKSPRFTIVALTTLALGMGGNSAIFSLVYGVLLRPLPYPGSDRIVAVKRATTAGSTDPNTTGGKYSFEREHQRTLQYIAADKGNRAVSFEAVGHPERIRQRAVTADFFRVLGIQPQAGRFFDPAEDRPGATPVAVLGYGFWVRHFGKEASAIGRSIPVGKGYYTVIGVAPANIDSSLASDVWTPLSISSDPMSTGENLMVLGRMKEGVSIAQAQADMAVVASGFRANHPKGMQPTETIAVSLYQDEVGTKARSSLLIMLGAVGLVLLIACANMANLLLARIAGRRREIALRLSIGASRSRVLRQLLTESVVLSLAGSVLAIGLAELAVSALAKFHPVDLPRLDEVAVNFKVLLFTAGLAVVTGIIFGIAPAIRALRTDLQEVLRDSGARTGEGRGAGVLRSILVVSELGLSIILLIGATLLIQSFARLNRVDPGFNPANVLTIQMSPPASRYKTASDISHFAQRAVELAEGEPSVAAAAMCTYLPLANSFKLPLEALPGRPKPADRYLDTVKWMAVTPRFFEVMKIPVRTGRAFGAEDSSTSPRVVIVNEAFAKKHFPRTNPIGQTLTIGWAILGAAYADAPRQIVGVAADFRDAKLESKPAPSLFVPMPQMNDASIGVLSALPATLVMRTRGNPANSSRQAAATLQTIDPLLPIYNIRTMEQVVSDSLQGQRFQTMLLAGFAFIALTLAVVGIYGVVSYSVTQRARELAIRAALGAEPFRIRRMVIRQVAVLTAFGLGIGVAGAFALTRLLASLLFEVGSRDLASFVAAPLFLSAVGLLAGYLPARHASGVDPMDVLRQQ